MDNLSVTLRGRIYLYNTMTSYLYLELFALGVMNLDKTQFGDRLKGDCVC
jgi:hypothetical protein